MPIASIASIASIAPISPISDWIAFVSFPPVRIQEKIAFTLWFLGTVLFFVWVVRLWWKR
jgi:hypothetical protein